jgi:hypothetical protein
VLSLVRLLSRVFLLFVSRPGLLLFSPFVALLGLHLVALYYTIIGIPKLWQDDNIPLVARLLLIAAIAIAAVVFASLWDTLEVYALSHLLDIPIPQ